MVREPRHEAQSIENTGPHIEPVEGWSNKFHFSGGCWKVKMAAIAKAAIIYSIFYCNRN
jgi:hypothetical protein